MPMRSEKLPLSIARRTVSTANEQHTTRTIRVPFDRAYFSLQILVIIAARFHGSVSGATRFTALQIPRIYDAPCESDKVMENAGVGTNEYGH